MGNCLSNCQSVSLLPIPTTGCTIDIRQKTLSRILFMPCTVALPNPITCANIAALFTAGMIVGTSELANIVVNDPTTEDVVYSECRPVRKQIMTREITFEDRIALTGVTTSPPQTSPPGITNYFDYDFWRDKMSARLQLRYMLVWCDNDVTIPVDANGNLLTADLEAFLSYQKPSTQGGAWIEFKKASITFVGDPLNFIKPSFNLTNCGITV